MVRLAGLMLQLAAVASSLACAWSLKPLDFLFPLRLVKPSPLSNITCDPEDVAFASITQQVCQMNWVITFKTFPFEKVKQVGCWSMRAYNTDLFLSSAVFQRGDHCVLAMSGYHGKIVGMERAALSLSWPPKRWDVCQNKAYAPFVRLLRHHTSLGGWRNVTRVLGGPDSKCKKISISAESMGGSMGELLAACANAGTLAEVQAPELHTFQVDQLYTFGAPAASVEPIRNPLTKDGCFPGKRIFAHGDVIASLGKLLKLKHSRMDAVELFHTGKTVTKRTYSCESNDAVTDEWHKAPPAPQAILAVLDESNAAPGDLTHHEISSYVSDLQYLHAIGQGIDGGLVELANRGAVFVAPELGEGHTMRDYSDLLRKAAGNS